MAEQIINISTVVRAPALDRLVKKIYAFTKEAQPDLMFGNRETKGILEIMAAENTRTYSCFLTSDTDVVGKIIMEVAMSYKKAPELNGKFGLCLCAFGTASLLTQGGDALQSKEYIRTKEFVDLGRELAAIGAAVDGKDYRFSAKKFDGDNADSQYVEFEVEILSV